MYLNCSVLSLYKIEVYYYNVRVDYNVMRAGKKEIRHGNKEGEKGDRRVHGRVKGSELVDARLEKVIQILKKNITMNILKKERILFNSCEENKNHNKSVK